MLIRLRECGRRAVGGPRASERLHGGLRASRARP